MSYLPDVLTKLSPKNDPAAGGAGGDMMASFNEKSLSKKNETEDL